MSDPFQRYQQAGLQHQEAALTFEQELVTLLNKHSKENYSGTPDWILTEFLRKCLEAWDLGVRLRADWRGESTDLPALIPPEKGHKVVPMVVPSGGLTMGEEIGEAEIKMAAKVQVNIGRIDHVVAVFEDDPPGKDETLWAETQKE